MIRSCPCRPLRRPSPISCSRIASCVRLELRPLPSTAVTRLQRYYEPVRHPGSARPVPRGCPVGGPTPPPSGLPVLRLFSCCRHAVASTPVESSRPCRSRCLQHDRTMAAFPVIRAGRLPHWNFRGLLGVHACYGLSARQVTR